MLTQKQIDEARKKYGITPPPSGGGKLTPEQVEEARQKYGIPPTVSSLAARFPTEAPQEIKQSLLSRLAGGVDKVLGPVSKAAFGGAAKAVGSVVGAGVEAGQELLGNKTQGKFTAKAEQAFGTPKEAAKTIGSAALDLTVAGFGEKTIAKVAKLTKTPLTKVAEKLYQSALKPQGKLLEKGTELAKTGLKERVFLTTGGVERVAAKIDDFESLLGEAIDKANDAGVTISTKGMAGYLDEAKKFFANQLDVADAQKALTEIDALGQNFIAKYGDDIPIKEAQKIKVETGRLLRKYYDRLTSAGIEGQKQGVRYLKEKIVEKAPIVGDINKRLKSLYEFDEALGKSQGRIKNLNLLGLASKIGGAAAGPQGLLIGKLLELADAPMIKSGAAIGLNELSQGGGSS